MILKRFAEQAKELNGSIVFPEGDEERTLEAAVRLARDGVCRVTVVSPAPGVVEELGRRKNLDLKKLTVLVPGFEHLDAGVVGRFIESRQVKGVAEADARATALEQLTFAALYVKSGKADGGVGGARSATSDLLRAAIHGIGPAEGIRLISSFFLMVPPENHPLIKEPIVYADCGVNPSPSDNGLRDIAVCSVGSFKSLFPARQPAVAFLSFSTKGSAEHRTLEKIKQAVEATKQHFAADASVAVDGEMQFDTAAVPAVAARKAPGSPVAGVANIFIFPDLNAGNICYKVTERLAGFTAIGPIVQGLAKPFNDLSRGCSVDDIYYAAVIALLQSKRQ